MKAKRLVRSAALVLALAASGQANAVPVELALSGSFVGMAGTPLSVTVSSLSQVEIPAGGASLDLILSFKDLNVPIQDGVKVNLDPGFVATFLSADLLVDPDPLQPFVDTGEPGTPASFSGGILTWTMTLTDPKIYPFTVSLIGRSLTDEELFSGVQEGALTVRAIPEPSTWTLLICSLAAVGFGVRRRRPE